MEGKRSRWHRIKEDFRINKPLIPLKLTMFTYYGAMTLFLPYLTVHMVQIGITIEEVAIIYAVLPFVSCIGPPIAGMIADKLSRYKPVLMCAITLCATFHTLLTTVDARGYVDEPLNQSDFATLAWVSSDNQGSSSFQWTSCNCNYSTLATDGVLVELNPQDCDFSCPGDSLSFCTDSSVCTILDTVVLGLQTEEANEGVSNDTLCSADILNLVISNGTETGRLVAGCDAKCPVTLLAPETLCSPNITRHYDHAKHLRGFWLYFILRVLATASLGTSFSMLDATSLCMVKKYRGELGKQRLFGIIGSSVFGLASGFLLDFIASVKGYKDYSIIYYVSDGIFVITLIMISRLDVEVERGEGTFLRNVSKLVKLIDVDFFMVVMLLLGTCWGFLESFLFIFLLELKASSSLLGFTVTLGSVVGVPFLFISDKIVKKIGKIAVLIIAFFIYCIRFLGYSFIEDPWLSLPFEALEAVTIHLMSVASVMFCASAAPAGVLATMNGLVGGLHYSAGRGMGSFIGGTLIALYGTRVTLRIFGISAAIVGFVYAVIYRLFLRKLELKRLKKRSDQEAATEAMQRIRMLEDKQSQQQHPVKQSLLVPPEDFIARRLSF